MFRLFVILGISTLLFGSCKIFKPNQSVSSNTSNQTSSNTSTETPEDSSGKTSQILSVLLSVSSVKDTPLSFEVNKVKQTNGFLKKDARPANSKQLIAVFSDINKKVIDSVPFNDPTKEHKESVDENGKIVTVEKTQGKKAALVRVNFNPDIHWLEIQDIFGKTIQIIEIKKYIE